MGQRCKHQTLLGGLSAPLPAPALNSGSSTHIPVPPHQVSLCLSVKSPAPCHPPSPPSPSCRKQRAVASVWACAVGIPLPFHPTHGPVCPLYPSSVCPRGQRQSLELVAISRGQGSAHPRLWAADCEGVLWNPCYVCRAWVGVCWRPGPRWVLEGQFSG